MHDKEKGSIDQGLEEQITKPVPEVEVEQDPSQKEMTPGYQEYRDKLAQEIRAVPKDKKRSVLESAKNLRKYWEASLFKIEERRAQYEESFEEPIPTIDLLPEYLSGNRSQGEKLTFDIEDRDVYNISPPTKIEGRDIIIGRLEKRSEWAKSQVAFFTERAGVWERDPDLPLYDLEDSFVTQISDEIVFGGVRVWQAPDMPENWVDWQTVFYRGKDLKSLKEFAHSPVGMKDIRIAEFEDGSIGVFTRPWGGAAGRGKIGFVRLNSLDELTPENLVRARILKEKFVPHEWGGVNEIHVLPDGKVGIIGHISAFDKANNKHYYAISFTYDPATHRSSKIKIIAIREDFPEGHAKVVNEENPLELVDIVFPGGIVKNEDGSVILYCGLSDTEAGKITIPDPFEKKSA